MAAGGGVGKDAAESTGFVGVRCGAGRVGLRFRLIELSDGGIEERFLSARADPFAGSEWERKSRPAPFEMTVWVCGGE